MKRAWKIGIPSVIVGLVLITIIGYCAMYYLIDRPKELEQAESVDMTYIKMEMSPADLIDMPIIEGNAAQDYIKAIKLQGEEMEDVWLKEVEGMRLIYNTEASGLDYILAGARKKDCDFAAMEYQTAEGIVNFPTPTGFPWIVREPKFSSALRYANALATKGDRYFVLGEVQKAQQIYESILTFGHHLESSRQTILQFMVGVAVSAIGIERLEKFYSYQGDMEKAAKVKEYKAQSEEMAIKLGLKRGAIRWFQLEQFEAWIRILKEDEDAMFRRQAARNMLIIFVPVRLHNLFRRGRAAKALEEAMQSDEDQSVRETARNVLHLVQGKLDKETLSEDMPSIDLSEVLKKRAEEGETQTDDAETWLEKGLSYYREEQFDEAIDAYKQAVNLKPDYAEAHRRLGEAYHVKWKVHSPKIKEDLGPNETDQSPSFTRRPELSEMLQERGISVEELKNNPELRAKLARESMNRSDSGRAPEPMRPQKGVPMTESVDHTMGMLEDAKNEYELALKLDPDGVYTFVVHNYLGKLYKDKQMYDEAIAEYKKSIDLKLEYIPAYADLAEAYSAKGLHDEAIAELKRALFISDYSYLGQQNRTSPVIHYNLARAYSLKNDRAQAIESLKKAVEASRKYIPMAEDDRAFDSIRETPGFQELLSKGRQRRSSRSAAKYQDQADRQK